MVNATIPPRGMVLQCLNMYQKMIQKPILCKILPQVGPEWPQENHSVAHWPFPQPFPLREWLHIDHSPKGNGSLVLKHVPKDCPKTYFVKNMATSWPRMAPGEPCPVGEWSMCNHSPKGNDSPVHEHVATVIQKQNSPPTPIPIRDILHFLAWALSFL